MSLRFRKSVKIFPGFRVNFSGSGISYSAGIRGARITTGPRGTFFTTGIPGTGISQTQKIMGKQEHTPPKLASNVLYNYEEQHITVSSSEEMKQYIDSGRIIRNPRTGRRYSHQQLTALYERLLKNEKYVEVNNTLEAEEFDYDSMVNISKRSAPIPFKKYWDEALILKPFTPFEFELREPKRHEIEATIEETEFTNNPFSNFHWFVVTAVCVFLFSLVLSKSSYSSLALPCFIATFLFIALDVFIHFKKKREWKDKINRTIQQKTDQELEIQQEKWQAAQAEHFEVVRKLELEHTQTEQERVQNLRNLIQGDIEAIRKTLEDEFENIDAPFETEVSYEIKDNQYLYLDVDLPEVETTISSKEKRLLKSGEISEKNKPETKQREEYARLVTGLAFYLSSHAFTSCPTISKVLISGYTQRINKATGQREDQYIYSINIDKETYSGIDFTNSDPIEAFSLFHVKWKKSTTNIFSTIEPMTP